ncbi:hypothetical protein QE369_001857 [Agrobacterium larrymoorei]|uniref:Uncharacterized protein n=1 Tax=Agrobacterium larrymoorei TaxID=160699 RepID=A0AAJ2ERD2_9HYPH|nr:hypothetical protein [Agrobacterium larrymoorei]MDR6101679.1 hypothetical protein [Agrobacterium larrymoorei]
MDQSRRTEPYTLEQLQQKYSLSISRAADVMDRFGGDRALIDKIMKRRHQNQGDGHRKAIQSAAIDP